MIVETLLAVTGVYLLAGLVFAVPFVLLGVSRIDPHATQGSWGFRVLIIPGTMFLWPLLARRWMRGIHAPPQEKNPHRHAASLDTKVSGPETGGAASPAARKEART
jgi:hypothetical protein